MPSTKIVIIGGVACGPKAASRARRRDPDAEITIIEKGSLISYAGCGMPYYVEGLVEERDRLMQTPAGARRDAAFFRAVKNIAVLTRTLATRVDREARVVHARNLDTGEELVAPYDKLVLATGGVPVVPRMEGTELSGVHRLYHPDEAAAVRERLMSGAVKNAVIVGGGLIGMEMAEALSTHGVSITMVEMLDHLLPALLDHEPAAFLTKHLKANDVNVVTGTKVTALLADDVGRVRAVQTDAGELPAEFVLLSLGVRPNVELARDCGLALGETGALAVNGRLQTSDPDIYAGGDCVECTHLITGRKCFVPLGSTANKHGRVIGDNVTGGDSTFRGIVGTTVFRAYDFNVGRTGLSEAQARKEGYEVVTALSPAPDRAHYMPGNQPILVKLVAEASTGKLLGAQVVGPGEAVKRIDVMAVALTMGATLEDLADFDLGYAPPYAPAVDNIATAANIVRNKREGLARTLTPAEVKAKLDAGDDFVWLDVRSPDELKEMRLDDARVVHIPLGKLRERAGELPKDKPIVAFCMVSLRGYEAQRTLDGLGFPNVRFMDGGIVGWPYGGVVKGE
jgi:NADPH-dependent 2,4-dienoyl-CoA reductase/sulfur reductase-like enzyme/rhodanese-related sulfurtransferase